MCDVAALLDENRHQIVQYVQGSLNAIEASYTTVWRDYEDAAIKAFVEKLKDLIPTITDDNIIVGEEGTEKNRVADLEVRCAEGSTLISVKTANAEKNPENDLGTIRQYPSKKAKFPNSFDLWIRWRKANGHFDADGIFFDRSYRFIGRMKKDCDGVKYRKKDGNMRPKSWGEFDRNEHCWNSVEEFEEALERSKRFRANSLVQEHIENMTDEDLKILYDGLRLRFGDDG